MLQQVKLTTVKAVKSIMPFSIAVMILWVILLTLWFGSVGLFDWSLTDSLLYFPIIAFVYIVADMLGIAVIGAIYSSSKMKFNRLFNSVLGFIVGILMIGLSSSIIWLLFYSNDNSVRLGEMVFNPLLSIPNLITAAVLVYSGWQINILAIPEIQK
jgi:hypothetical protein